VTLVALIVAAILFVPTSLPGALAGRSAARSEAPPYARPGPQLVGLRALTSDDGASLDLMLWYPALSSDAETRATRYPYRVKMGDPLGTVSVAGYAGRAITDAPYDLSPGPYPTVILSPGFIMGTTDYGWLAEHLASYGFVVVGIEHREVFDEEVHGLWRATVTRPQDILDVLAYLDAAADQGGALVGLLDSQLLAVIGHSYGGYTALAAAGARIDTQHFEAVCESAYESDDPIVFLCDQVLPHLDAMAQIAGLESVPEGLWPAWADPRVDAIVPLAGDALFFGQAGLAPIAVPLMAIGGTLDRDSPYMWGTHPTYEYASSPAKVRIALTGAEHMIFTGPCERQSLFSSFLMGQFCSDAHWDRNRAHDLINHFTTAFLLAILKEDPAAGAALQPERVEFPGVEFESQGF
jgi:predicted dienelactone hydrolase